MMPAPRKDDNAPRQVRAAYAGEEERPLGSFAALMGTYAVVVAGVAAAARLTGRKIPEPTAWDVVLWAGANHRLSRLIAKDPVTSPLRAPFTRFEGTTGPAELAEQVRGRGTRKAIGELLTCPFCTSLWVATGSLRAPSSLPRQRG
ncbi:DUF1360 domain-containing protein [Streptomyces sp. RB6PN25]|uniref:DUF1360 domain-containing protein n=1 Tax=Streptomyces humicola TaxID=2953240 RepID=A0ABT1PNV2_9ACTN|nr:DUF1360 domain-containing protein [Streptomyces humicola]MCQ4079351.1 DUF1360 domain-containing protein [Streptomyces humicola]